MTKEGAFEVRKQHLLKSYFVLMISSVEELENYLVNYHYTSALQTIA